MVVFEFRLDPNSSELTDCLKGLDTLMQSRGGIGGDLEMELSVGSQFDDSAPTWTSTLWQLPCNRDLYVYVLTRQGGGALWQSCDTHMTLPQWCRWEGLCMYLCVHVYASVCTCVRNGAINCMPHPLMVGGIHEGT